MALVFLEGLLALGNVYEKVKIFKNNQVKKTQENHRCTIWSKEVFLYINNTDKILT